MIKFFRNTFLISIILISSALSQSEPTIFKGKVSDEKGEALPFASVALKENNSGASTDKNGLFKIMTRPGKYTVEVTFIGYTKVVDHITLEKGKQFEKNYTLISASFEIGGIQVTADNQFIPNAPETKTTVGAGQIEHIQASSLSDIMSFMPGVETINPSLSGAEQATIRGGDAIGTQIMLDGIPISNNANMQEGIGHTVANRGIDLRAIPADNIKEVEIIRGIPSAKYGDLTDGLMIVKTKAVAEPFRVKYKYNPNINEFNFSKGFNWGSWVLNSNFNVAVSDSDKRVEGDGYTRFAGQLSAEKGNDDYNIKNIIYVTRAIDETKEQRGDAARNAWYNRDLNLKYTGNFAYNFSSFSSLNADVSVGYTYQDSYNQTVVSRDNVVISDRLDEGTQEGTIVFGSYLGKKWIKGDVWNLYSNLSYNFRFFTDEYLHSWTTGITWRDDFNKGKGVIFDPLYPPSLSVPTMRIRTYDDLPQYNILSLFAEDKITGNFIKPFTLQYGARYEVYRPNGINLKGLIGKGDLIESYNGSFLNPRINLSFNLADKTQLRFGYGVTSKSPPMGMIFAQQKYYDITDTVAVVNAAYPDSNFSLISTYIRPYGNEYLKGYTQKKYEFSLDQQIGSVGFTLTGFINNTSNMFTSETVPIMFYKKSFPNYPDLSTSIITDSVIETGYQYQNNGWSKVRGLEFSFKTERIPAISTVFNFDASYTYSESGTNSGISFGVAKYSSNLGMTVVPRYNDYNQYHKSLLLNYKFDIQAKPLGMWLTLQIQQRIIEIEGRKGYDDTLATGYFTQKGQMIDIPQNERASAKYSQITKSIQAFELLEEDKPNKWLINVKVSKSLWNGAAISFFVNNILNNQPLYLTRRHAASSPTYERRNPEIFYGIEFGASLGGL